MLGSRVRGALFTAFSGFASIGNSTVVMSKDDPKQSAAETPAQDAQSAARLERRLLIFRATWLLGGAAALGYYYVSQRRLQAMSDNDPTDPRGGGRGSKRSSGDNDPNDPERKNGK